MFNNKSRWTLQPIYMGPCIYNINDNNNIKKHKHDFWALHAMQPKQVIVW